MTKKKTAKKAAKKTAKKATKKAAPAIIGVDYIELLDARMASMNTRITLIDRFIGLERHDLERAPLDGVQAATKDYVDRALERLAGSIRREILELRYRMRDMGESIRRDLAEHAEEIRRVRGE